MGGLKPPPAGRLRRADNPSSPAQHHLKKRYLHHAPLSVRDTRGSRLSGFVRGVLDSVMLGVEASSRGPHRHGPPGGARTHPRFGDDGGPRRVSRRRVPGFPLRGQRRCGAWRDSTEKGRAVPDERPKVLAGRVLSGRSRQSPCPSAVPGHALRANAVVQPPFTRLVAVASQRGTVHHAEVVSDQHVTGRRLVALEQNLS